MRRANGHPWADPVAASADFRWPRTGRIPWPPSSKEPPHGPIYTYRWSDGAAATGAFAVGQGRRPVRAAEPRGHGRGSGGLRGVGAAVSGQRAPKLDAPSQLSGASTSPRPWSALELCGEFLAGRRRLRSLKLNALRI